MIASPLCADIAEEDAEGDDTVLGELPLEVLQHMFSLLDPVTLGTASCVCTTWYALSQDDSLWQRCLAQIAIASSSSHNRSATRRQQFNAVVASKAVMLRMHTRCSGFAIASQDLLTCCGFNCRLQSLLELEAFQQAHSCNHALFF